MEPRRCYGCMNMIEEEICPHCGHSANQHNQPHQLPAGTILKNQFQVGRVLGQGGFGITYIGLDLNLDTVVAIKEFFPVAIVNRDVAQGLSVRLNAEDSKEQYEACRDRFLREARALAKLQDIREIVSVRSLFQENNTAYITMEYVQGADLRHFVRQQGGQMSVQSLFAVIEPTLRALNTVHKAGLVHRDISPDNIMVMPDGSVKLLDFGAVRSVGDEDASIDLSHSTEAILKHGFAPMEQYRSRGNMGPWTDEYGICATVYYCLTGKVPPDAPSRAMGEEDVDWSTVPGLQEHQRAALEKGMSMRAKDRFGDLEELRKALFEAPAPVAEEEKEAPEITSVTLKKKGRGGLIAAVLLLAALGAGAFWFMNRKPAEPVMEAVPTETEAVETTEPVQTEAPTTAPVETETVMETETTAATEPTVHVEEYSGPWVDNVMIYNPLDKMDIDRAKLYSVEFRDTTELAPGTAVDISQNGDGSVLGWIEWTENPQIYFSYYIKVIIAADGGINAKNACKDLFFHCWLLREITFGEHFHTEQADNMEYMFYYCGDLASVDIEHIDTRNVSNMRGMFGHCKNLESLDLSHFETGKVTDMSYMFYNCNFPEYLDLMDLDISSVKNMEGMLGGCSDSSVLECVSDWDMSKVENISGMFAGSDLSGVDLGDWDVSGVVNMSNLFNYSRNLNSTCLRDWNVSNVEDMSYMFYFCDSVSDMALRDWDVSSTKKMEGMFAGCTYLDYVDLTSWDVSSVQNMTDMFDGCLGLVEVDLSNWDTSSVYSMSGMFRNCKELKHPRISQWDVSSVTSMAYMFQGCWKVDLSDLSGWDVSNVKNYTGFVESSVMVNGGHWKYLFE